MSYFDDQEDRRFGITRSELRAAGKRRVRLLGGACAVCAHPHSYGSPHIRSEKSSALRGK